MGKNTSLKVDGKREKIRLVDKTFVSQLLLGLVASEVFFKFEHVLSLSIFYFLFPLARALLIGIVTKNRCIGTEMFLTVITAPIGAANLLLMR